MRHDRLIERIDVDAEVSPSRLVWEKRPFRNERHPIPEDPVRCEWLIYFLSQGLWESDKPWKCIDWPVTNRRKSVHSDSILKHGRHFVRRRDHRVSTAYQRPRSICSVDEAIAVANSNGTVDTGRVDRKPSWTSWVRSIDRPVRRAEWWTGGDRTDQQVPIEQEGRTLMKIWSALKRSSIERVRGNDCEELFVSRSVLNGFRLETFLDFGSDRRTTWEWSSKRMGFWSFARSNVDQNRGFAPEENFVRRRFAGVLQQRVQLFR